MKTYSTHGVLLVVIAMATLSYSQQGCFNSKKARKVQEDLLNTLNKEDVVVGVKFIDKDGSKYRFAVTQIWRLHSGNLIPGDDISVILPPTPDSFTNACFEGLRYEERYILILKPDTAGVFVAIAPPISARKHNHKQYVWKQLCGETDEECRLVISRITLPSQIIIYNKRNEFIRCQVNSRYRVTKIRWMKDYKDIADEGGDFYAENGVFVHKTNLRGGFSDLVIYDAHSINSGRYTCITENEKGESDEATTIVSVRSLTNTDANFVSCPAGTENYCFNHGICKALRDVPNSMMCECKTGYTGVRCQDSAVSVISLEVAENNVELRGKVKGLTAAIIGLAIGLVLCVPIVALFVYTKIRNSLKTRSNESASHNNSNDTQFSSLINTAEIPVVKIKADANAPLQSSNSMKTQNAAKLEVTSNPEVSLKIPNINVLKASPRSRLKAERS